MTGMPEFDVVSLIGVLLVVGVMLRRLTRRSPRRGARDQRLAQGLQAHSAQEVDLVDTLVSEGWLWPRSAGGEHPDQRLETKAAARDPRDYPHVELAGTVVAHHRLRRSASSQDLAARSLALARLPGAQGGQALFVQGGATPEEAERLVSKLPKAADLRYVDEVAEPAHQVDPLLDLSWSTWAPDASAAREWLAQDESLRNALRAGAPRSVTIGRAPPSDLQQERHPDGSAGRALRHVVAIEVHGERMLVVCSGDEAQAAQAAEALIELHSTPAR